MSCPKPARLRIEILGALTVLSIGLLLSPSAISDTEKLREFKNRAGKTILAKIASADETHVSLLTKTNGKPHKIKLSTLSVPDQKFIAEWRLRNADFSATTVVKAKERKLSGSEKKKSGSYDFTEDWAYDLEIINDSEVGMSALDLKYVVYAKVRDVCDVPGKEKANRIRLAGSGSQRMAAIPPGQKFLLRTGILRIRQMMQIDKVPDGKKSTAKTTTHTTEFTGSLEGLAVRGYDEKGEVVFEWTKAMGSQANWEVTYTPGPEVGNGQLLRLAK